MPIHWCAASNSTKCMQALCKAAAERGQIDMLNVVDAQGMAPLVRLLRASWVALPACLPASLASPSNPRPAAAHARAGRYRRTSQNTPTRCSSAVPRPTLSTARGAASFTWRPSSTRPRAYSAYSSCSLLLSHMRLDARVMSSCGSPFFFLFLFFFSFSFPHRRVLLEHAPQLLNQSDADGRTPLHIAVGSGTWLLRPPFPRAGPPLALTPFPSPNR